MSWRDDDGVGDEAPYLEVLSGAEEGREYDVAAREIVIGRGAEVHVRISDKAASRHHCRIWRTDDGQWALEDLGSANGTEVRGHPVRRARLHDRDIIRIGGTQLRWNDLGPLEDDNAEDEAARVSEAATVPPDQDLSGWQEKVAAAARVPSRQPATANGIPDWARERVAQPAADGPVDHGRARQRPRAGRQAKRSWVRPPLLWIVFGVAAVATGVSIVVVVGGGSKHGYEGPAEAEAESCNVGDQAACLALGKRLLAGDGVPKDLTSGARKLTSACQSGHAAACTEGAKAAISAQQWSLAETLLGVACDDHGDGDACLSLGDYYADDESGERQPGKAATAYESACQAGTQKGCFHYGSDLLREPDRQEEGMTLLRNACNEGVEEACCPVAHAEASRVLQAELDCLESAPEVGPLLAKIAEVERKIRAARKQIRADEETNELIKEIARRGGGMEALEDTGERLLRYRKVDLERAVTALDRVAPGLYTARKVAPEFLKGPYPRAWIVARALSKVAGLEEFAKAAKKAEAACVRKRSGGR